MYDLYHKSMDLFLIQLISPYSRVSKHAGGSSHSWPKLTWFEPGSVTVRNRSRRLIGQSLSMMSMAFMWNVHVRGFPFRFHHFFFYCLSAWAFFFFVSVQMLLPCQTEGLPFTPHHFTGPWVYNSKREISFLDSQQSSRTWQQQDQDLTSHFWGIIFYLSTN